MTVRTSEATASPRLGLRHDAQSRARSGGGGGQILREQNRASAHARGAERRPCHHRRDRLQSHPSHAPSPRPTTIILLAVKGNEPTLQREMENATSSTHRRHRSTSPARPKKAMSRIGARRHVVCRTIDWLSRSARRSPMNPLARLTAVAMVEDHIKSKKDKPARRYYISSAPLTALRLAQAVRLHSGCELPPLGPRRHLQGGSVPYRAGCGTAPKTWPWFAASPSISSDARRTDEALKPTKDRRLRPNPRLTPQPQTLVNLNSVPWEPGAS